mmetsp:Transcript_23697/g.26310  ORF Transcript_23697/g.26310 Transcript_23697/m.26310 type:complete len:161 (-) Transcript_23697:316-798(-)
MGSEESAGQINGGGVSTESYPLRQLEEINLEANNGVTYLSPPDTNQKTMMNSLINNAKKVYLNRNTEFVESTGLYQKLDLSECGASRMKVDPTTINEDEPAFESIHFKLQSLKNATNKNKIDSVVNRALPFNSDIETSSENMNLPAPINMASKLKEQTMF